MKPTVPIGPGTLINLALIVLGVAGTIVSASGTNLHLSTESIAILTGGIAVAMHALRSWQKVKK